MYLKVEQEAPLTPHQVRVIQQVRNAPVPLKADWHQGGHTWNLIPVGIRISATGTIIIDCWEQYSTTAHNGSNREWRWSPHMNPASHWIEGVDHDED